MDYLLLKAVHQTAAALSITGFAARVLGVSIGAAWVRHRLARTLPHVVDSVLLAAALAMAWAASFNPLGTPWLLAKILALLAYIALGRVALQPGGAPVPRALAAAGALAVAAYIVSVAITKSPLGFLAGL